jgi:hypothetical protein
MPSCPRTERSYMRSYVQSAYELWLTQSNDYGSIMMNVLSVVPAGGSGQICKPGECGRTWLCSFLIHSTSSAAKLANHHFCLHTGSWLLCNRRGIRTLHATPSLCRHCCTFPLHGPKICSKSQHCLHWTRPWGIPLKKELDQAGPVLHRISSQCTLAEHIL